MKETRVRSFERREIRTQNSRHGGARRLLQILVSEAAHLIWVLRRKRLIQNTEYIHTERKFENLKHDGLGQSTQDSLKTN